MSDAFIMRRGGAGGTKTFAFIVVSYPSGSSVSCQNTTTSKIVNGTVVNSKYVFAVPTSGVWRITLSDGSNSKYQDVSLSASDEGASKNIDLGWELYLIQDGQTKVTFTKYQLGLNSSYPNTSGSTSTSTSNGLLKISSNASNSASQYLAKVDLSKYNKLIFTGSVTNSRSEVDDTYCPRFAIVSASAVNGYIMEKLSLYHRTFKEYVSGSSSSSTRYFTNDVAIDVSNLTGQHYVGFSVMGNGEYFSVKDLYLTE